MHASRNALGPLAAAAWRRGSVVILLVLTSLSCGGSGDAPVTPGSTVAPSVDAGQAAPDVAELLGRMTLEEKIGQMTQAERTYLVAESDIRDDYLGSVLSGGGSSPVPNNPTAWADMCDRYQQQALSTRLRIPLLYGADVVHGHNNLLGAVIFPHDIGLGCSRSPALVEQVERLAAEEALATGVRWAFSPCIAVPRDERWGRTYEGFGETPELAFMMAPAAVRGFQSGGRLLACAKHFLADGGTAGGVDQGDARIGEGELRAIHLAGYEAAVAAGVGSIMVSFSSWNGVKMHANRHLLTDVLKGELGFAGFLVSDWGAVDQLPGDYATQVETAVNAGVDMVMVPGRYREFVATLRSLALSGRVPMSRIDDAVRRILSQKVRIGLFEHPLADRSSASAIGSAEHREVARDAVRRSLVLLKNEGRLLPLSRGAIRIHVAGSRMDDVGSQCGGWTITWQGSPGAVTPGTSILQAVRNAVSPSTTVTASADGSGASGADAAVVVVGETPYAEGVGDRADLGLSGADLAAVERVKLAGVPTAVVLISGRPLILGRALSLADAFVAAWLPGTEGDGVADVLFGSHPPTGRLSHSWPRSMSQVPINVGDAGYEPLFPYGYGLTY
jgi:beta-glucosidase